MGQTTTTTNTQIVVCQRLSTISMNVGEDDSVLSRLQQEWALMWYRTLTGRLALPAPNNLSVLDSFFFLSKLTISNSQIRRSLAFSALAENKTQIMFMTCCSLFRIGHLPVWVASCVRNVGIMVVISDTADNCKRVDLVAIDGLTYGSERGSKFHGHDETRPTTQKVGSEQSSAFCNLQLLPKPFASMQVDII